MVHGALYFFLILQAVSGYVRVTTGGFPIEGLEALGIPPLLPKAEGVGKIASGVHEVSAICLIAAHRDARRRGRLSRDRQAGRGFLDDVAADRAEAAFAMIRLGNLRMAGVWNAYGRRMAD